MAFTFTDGFDCYAASADAILGYWDTGNAAGASLATGRFTGSRAWRTGSASSTTAELTKNSGSNDAVHHIHVAFNASAVSGTNNVNWITLLDGSTAQCSIVFQSGGNILLASGAANGTVLATYTSAFTASGTWYSFEFEVVINNTTGSFKVRKNGNTSDDFSATSLNTRPTSTNNYANRLSIGRAFSTVQDIDDFVWKSSAAAGTWIGEVRCRTRYPNGDSGAPQWTRAATGAALTQIVVSNTTIALSADVAKVYGPVTLNFTGTIASLTVGLSGTVAGNVKVAIWADNGAGTAPAAVLGQSAGQVAISGANACPMVSPPSVVAGQKIWFAANFSAPGAMRLDTISVGSQMSMNVAYASFPQNNPTLSGTQACCSGTLTWSAATGNYQMISERQQDGAASYNYDSTVNDIDRFTIEPIDVTPATTFATTVRGLLQKSDAGTRNTQVMIKSGSTEVGSGSAALNASAWGWQYRTDETDPAGGAWTATAVNNLLIGVQVTA